MSELRVTEGSQRDPYGVTEGSERDPYAPKGLPTDHAEVVEAAEHVKLTSGTGQRWVEVVIEEIQGMVDHSAIDGEEGEPNWRGVTR